MNSHRARAGARPHPHPRPRIFFRTHVCLSTNCHSGAFCQRHPRHHWPLRPLPSKSPLLCHDMVITSHTHPPPVTRRHRPARLLPIEFHPTQGFVSCLSTARRFYSTPNKICQQSRGALSLAPRTRSLAVWPFIASPYLLAESACCNSFDMIWAEGAGGGPAEIGALALQDTVHGVRSGGVDGWRVRCARRAPRTSSRPLATRRLIRACRMHIQSL